MYNLLYILKKDVRGNGLVAEYMARTYGANCRAIDVSEQEIPPGDRIWILHRPGFYQTVLGKFPATPKDFTMVRANLAGNYPGIPTTNGWSYLMSHRKTFRAWLPDIYAVEFGKNDKPSVGYYYRDMRQESNREFEKLVKTLPPETEIVTMGDKAEINPTVFEGRTWRHVYDNKVFWEGCSHYFYHRPIDFQDPFPHTLLEAVQSGHRIISTVNPKRDFSDGIDDILSCIDSYDTEFIPENEGNPSELLSPEVAGKAVKVQFHIGLRVPTYRKRKTFGEFLDGFR